MIPLEIIEVEGIIIDEKPYGETSKILNIITKDKGVIGVLAKGAKRLKSPLRSVSERFCYASFKISYKEDKLSILLSADVINPFSNIKKLEENSIDRISSELKNTGVIKENKEKKFEKTVDIIGTQ